MPRTFKIGQVRVGSGAAETVWLAASEGEMVLLEVKPAFGVKGAGWCGNALGPGSEALLVLSFQVARHFGRFRSSFGLFLFS